MKHLHRLLKLHAAALLIFLANFSYAQEVRTTAKDPQTAEADVILQVQDRLAILELISSYGYSWDAKNADAFLDLFSPNGSWEHYSSNGIKPTDKVTGRDEMLKAIKQRFAQLQKLGIQTRNYETNILLTLKPDGKVEASTMILEVWQQKGKPAPVIKNTGICRSLIAKTIAGWKFASRSIYLDSK